eukprot:2608200-Pleurochrysis_carterae.AAC.1
MRMAKASSLQASMNSFMRASISAGWCVGVQLELVEVQDVLQVAVKLKELGPALVGELLGDKILGVIGHGAVVVKVGAARCC